MSDNIPFEIQTEIIKKVSDTKSLIQFRSVSNQWKSFIDTSEFIKGYITQARSHILSYKYDDNYGYEENYFVEDVDIETLKIQKQEVTPLLKQYRCPFFVGVCHGLLCWNGYNKFIKKEMVVIWNPSIRKSIGVAASKYRHDLWIGYKRVYGFGVCPGTSDPTVIEIFCADNKPWHVKVFTLSSGVWNVIPTRNLPRQSIILYKLTPFVIDRFIYWSAREKTYNANILVSFDLITKEFNVVDLPDSLKKGCKVSVSKLRESLVVYKERCLPRGGAHCGLWVMDHDSSFRKLFTIGAPVKLVAFKENGETIFKRKWYAKLDVYDPCSQQIKNLGISENLEGLFFMGSYKESVLLLDHPDLHIYSEDS